MSTDGTSAPRLSRWPRGFCTRTRFACFLWNALFWPELDVQHQRRIALLHLTLLLFRHIFPTLSLSCQRDVNLLSPLVSPPQSQRTLLVAFPSPFPHNTSINVHQPRPGARLCSNCECSRLTQPNSMLQLCYSSRSLSTSNALSLFPQPHISSPP